jgi:hypothetical protein
MFTDATEPEHPIIFVNDSFLALTDTTAGRFSGRALISLKRATSTARCLESPLVSMT